MRNIGPLIMLGLVVLAALGLFLMFGPLGEKPGMRYVEEAPEAPAAKPRKASGAAQPAGSGAERTEAAAGAEIASAAPAAAPEQPGVPVAAGNVPEKRRLAFPMASDIPVGTDRSALTARFGKPNMVTTAVDGGRLFETYVYLSSDPNNATVVLLRAGKVVAVNSTVY